ncbi:MAG: MGMT family protein [Actinobacteria bacterium]|nr:MGMT family protein [Actinomycetota bacterium]
MRTGGPSEEKSYYRVATVLGDIYIHAVGESPVRIGFLPPDPDIALGKGEPPPAVRNLMRALIHVLEGKEADREVVEGLLSSTRFSPFQRRVYRAVLSIPRGSTLSYRRVAELAGSPGAARAVGNAVRRNPFPVIIPCHRVIRSDGSPGGYSGPAGMKERLLGLEGCRNPGIKVPGTPCPRGWREDIHCRPSARER